MTELEQRYSPGGDIYAANEAAYGTIGAERIAAAFLRGGRPAVGEVVKELKLGPNAPSTSTLAIFAEQLATDPLAAPLESANRQIGKAVWNVLRNPWVLLTVVLLLLGVGVYFADRFGLIKRKAKA